MKKALLQLALFSLPVTAAAAQDVPASYRPALPVKHSAAQGSTYVPIDNWIYPALQRLQGLGYLDTGYLGIRPWTRLSILHMLEQTADRLDAEKNNDEARDIYLAVRKDLQPDLDNLSRRPVHAVVDSVYTRSLGITDTPLNDSYHVGQTIVNDYGRPFQAGYNNVSGLSARATAGRFALYVRGEYQHAPAAEGYSRDLFIYLSTRDFTSYLTNPRQDTIPLGPIPAENDFRLLEANVSYQLLGHEFSLGKSDHWLSPDRNGAFAWSNNSDNIYAFQIDRVEPLHVPLLSRLTGPFRYDFFVGSLQGHSNPNAPWEHTEKLSFKPYRDLEFGFERTAIWGGKGHAPITLHTFFNSFFSFQNVPKSVKYSREDPGARFGTFDFSWRLPYLRRHVTLYTDSAVHDDVSPISAPRRSGVAPGIFISQIPGAPHLDFRLEGVNTDPPTRRSYQGQFLFFEAIQTQGTTNKGFLFTNAFGRENKGGQAWLTYHLSPEEQVEVSFRRNKAAKDFITFGTTQNDYQFDLVKRFHKEVELRGWLQYEQWKAPLLKPGSQSNTSVSVQITWYPHNNTLLR